MLRSLCTSSLPWSPLPLERWCREGDWESVLAYLRDDPDRDNIFNSSDRSHLDSLLSSAIRCTSSRRVPLAVVQALCETDPAQRISNSPQGNGPHPQGQPRNTLLHEAIQYQATFDVIEFLLHHMLRSGCYCCPKDLMCSTDYLGRTPLHLLILRWQHRILGQPATSLPEQQWGPILNTANIVTEQESSITTMERLLNAFIDACPEACAIPDSDSTTPLIQLLQTNVPTSDEDNNYTYYYQQLRRQLEEAIRYMLEAYPGVARTAAQRPVSRGAIPWRYHATHHCSMATTCSHNFHTPLYYALLYGWGADTIQRLVHIMMENEDKRKHRSFCHEDKETDTNDGPATPSTPTVVTPFHETYLHVAVSVQAPANVLAVLVDHEPASAGARDCYNLTPLDWLWISHVRELRQVATGQHRTLSSRVSRRRYLASDFLEWHEQVASAVVTTSLAMTGSDSSDAERRFLPAACALQKEHLLSSMKVLLPAAAAAMCNGPVAKSGNWLHAAFSIPCPQSMRELALEAALHRSPVGDPELSSDIDSFLQCDAVNGRTLLHHAAAAVEPYTAVLPVGVSRGIKLLRESSQFWTVQRVMNCEASDMVDSAGQLPLHIAIDAFKQYRRATTFSTTSNASSSSLLSSRQTATLSAEEETREDQILDLIIFLNPSALEQLDSKTNFYPWMQAAVGEGARLTTIYSLFRRVPYSALQQMHG